MSASGRFLLRIPGELHERLRGAAARRGLSLNEFCARTLAGPPGEDRFGEAIGRAGELFGQDLVAVAVFGSWARGQAAPGSDIDLLVVLEDRVPLERALYARWDERPLRVEGRRVEPAFVHLPGPEGFAGGLWAEVALDAIVLQDTEIRLSRRLVAIRHDIAEGRLVRRTVHGHPYWASGVA